MSSAFSLYVQVRFRILPDETEHLGVLRCMTPGGLVFLTKRELLTQEILSLRVCSMEDDIAGSHCLLPSYARVRHVEFANQYYQVGVDFCPKPEEVDHLANQRNHQRHSCHMHGHYTRGGGSKTRPVEVLDLSQSGCRLKLREPLKVPGVIRLHIEPSAGNPLQKVLDAEVEITRCHHRGASIYEAGCRFLQAQLSNRKENAGT